MTNSNADKPTLFYAPQSRAFGALALLEELGAPYELRPLSLKTGEQRKPEFLALNPMGKVPAIRHRGEVVTEQGAIYLYLADAFPKAGLAPAIDDPLRGPYLRWLFFYGSALEPACVDKALKREAGPSGTVPYGDFDTTLATLRARLARGPWLLGDRFTAADVLYGTALGWLTAFGLIDKTPDITNYVERWNARPSVARATDIDAKLVAAQG